MLPSPTRLVFARLARAGLANELLVLAKAYLASSALGFRLVSPPWGLNRRTYWPYFYHSPLGGLGGELARRTMPTLTFDERAYRETALLDYGAAVSAWASSCDVTRQRRLAIECEGLWGGLIAVDRSREFIRSTLLGTRFTQANITEFLGRRDPGKLLVGVHIRRGDFASGQAGTESLRGRWNTRIPLDWFMKVCGSLDQELGGDAQFAVFSDGSEHEVAPVTGALKALATFGQRHTDCSDLLLMSLCDVLVCSPSSYSLLAAWLSDRPYLWPAAQCRLEDHHLSLWGSQPQRRPPSGSTAKDEPAVTPGERDPMPRGLPVGDDGVVAASLLAHLERIVRLKDRRTDLIYYGAVRSSAS